MTDTSIPVTSTAAVGITDAEVDKSRQEVMDLTKEIELAKLELAQSEAARNNAIESAIFDAEKTRLKAELDGLKAAIVASNTNVSEDTVVMQLAGSPVVSAGPAASDTSVNADARAKAVASADTSTTTVPPLSSPLATPTTAVPSAPPASPAQPPTPAN